MAKIKYVPAKAVNPYADETKELRDLGLPTPEGEAWAFEKIPADQVAKARVKIGEAARELGFTARFREAQPDGEGTVALIYTARVLDKARERKRKPEAAKPEAPKPGK